MLIAVRVYSFLLSLKYRQKFGKVTKIPLLIGFDLEGLFSYC